MNCDKHDSSETFQMDLERVWFHPREKPGCNAVYVIHCQSCGWKWKMHADATPRICIDCMKSEAPIECPACGRKALAAPDTPVSQMFLR